MGPGDGQSRDRPPNGFFFFEIDFCLTKSLLSKFLGFDVFFWCLKKQQFF